MGYGKAFQQYKRSNVETAGKLELIVMCYDKVILNLQQSINHIQDKEILKKNEKIKNSLDIINELQASLNFEKGDKIAGNLDSLYTYLTSRILQADIDKDFIIFDECINILSELKSAWEGISTGKEEPVLTGNTMEQEVRRLPTQIAV